MDNVYIKWTSPMKHGHVTRHRRI